MGDKEKKRTMANALVLLGSGVLGASIALLYAPQSGRRSRKEIARFGKSVGRKGDLAVRRFADNVIDFYEAVERKARRW